MTARTNLLDEIRRLLTTLAWDIKQKVQVNRMEDNISAENIGAGLLNLIYDYRLENANAVQQNQKGIDLFDDNANNGTGVAVQVTSSNTRPKVIRTITAFTQGEFPRLCDAYGTLVVLILTMDEKFPNWDKIPTSDNYQLSILSLMDLSRAVENLETPRLQKIHEYLVQELGDVTGSGVSHRDKVSAIGQILDIDILNAAEKDCTPGDLEKFYLVDTSFQLMLRVVCAGGDILHKNINATLGKLLDAGTPAILTGNSGCGKSTIMLRAAVEWVRRGNLALWVRFSESSPISDQAAKEFYTSLLKIIPAGQKALLCLDNPSEHTDIFRALARNWPDDNRIRLLLSERANRLSRLADASCDLLHHWFDQAQVVAMRPEHLAFRLKDYQIFYITDFKYRKELILKKVLPVLVRRGNIHIPDQYGMIQTLLRDYGKNNISLIELIYRTQFRLRDFATSPEGIRMDWDEWKTILRKELDCRKNARELYGVIALCSVFGVPMTVDLFCRMYDLPRYDLLDAIKNWRIHKYVEPVIYQEDSDTLLPKHEVAGQLFFLFHRDSLDHNALMEKIVAAMRPYELEPLLEQMVHKKSIRSGKRWPLERVNYDRLFRAIFDNRTGLFAKSRTRLGLGLLYAVPKDDRRNQGREVLGLLEGLEVSIAPDTLTASFYTEWGILAGKQKEFQLAEDRFRAVISADARNVHSRTELGRLLMTLKRFDEAEDVLRDAIQIKPTDIQSRTELGRLLMTLKRFDEAEDVLREAFKIEPDHIQSRTELGRLLMTLKRFDEAEAVLREAFKIEPDHIQSRTELGRLLMTLKRFDEAEDVLREAIRIDPKNLPPHTELGRLLMTLKRYDDAEDVLREAIRIDPKNLHPHTELGRLLMTLKRFDEAEDVLRKAIQIKPNDIQSRTELGRLLMTLKRYDDAEDVLREAFKIEPTHIQSRTELGRLLMILKRYDEAEAVLREAIRIDPKNLHPHTELGRLLMTLKRFDEAEDVLREAIRIDPKNLHPHTELGRLLVKIGKDLEAEPYFRKAIQLDSKQLPPRNELAKLCLRTARPEEARALYQEILKIKPNDRLAQEGLAQLEKN